MTLSAKLGFPSPFDSQHTFVTSPVFSPFVLAILRLSFAIYTLFTVIFVLVWEQVVEDSDGYFSYFTHLSLIGLTAYFFAAAVQTFVYAHGNRMGYPLQRWPRPLQFLHVLLHSTIVTYPILVTAVYWGLLASSKTFESRYSSWSNVSQHILNAVFALFEILFTHAMPSPWLHLPILVLFLLGYLGVAYITHATQGFYTYSFLNPQKQGAKLAAYIAGIAIGEVVVFLLVRGVVLLRERLFTRRARRKATYGGGEKMEEWEDIERPGTPMAI